MSHTDIFMIEASRVALGIVAQEVERLVLELAGMRECGARLYVVGLGGSAANASHAAADLRNLCGLDATCLTDSVAELTAGANDEGWESAFMRGMRRAKRGDALLVMSVGGGAQGVSLPLVDAVDRAKERGLKVLGIVGRDGGYVKAHGDHVVLIPTVSEERVTPHTEAFQMVVVHCLVSHPALQMRATKW